MCLLILSVSISFPGSLSYRSLLIFLARTGLDDHLQLKWSLGRFYFSTQSITTPNKILVLLQKGETLSRQLTVWFPQESVSITSWSFVIVGYTGPLTMASHFILWLAIFYCRNSSSRSQMIEEEELANKTEMEWPGKWEENTEVSQMPREECV